MANTHAGSDLSRRLFVQLAGLSALSGTALGRGVGAFAGPFSREDFLDDFPIPADKKFDPAWVASLTAKGAPTVYSSLRDELKYIGMPVGGLCCGQVYLGGDGQLWHWDILNLPQGREWADSGGPQYAKPAVQKSPFEQGFDLVWTVGGVEKKAELSSKGFRDIEFIGEYPIGRVRYRDASCPLEVELEAFSPFCPTDAEESSLPAIVVRYTVKNVGKEDVKFSVVGRLQNPVCLGTGLAGEMELIDEPFGGGAADGSKLVARKLPEDATKPKRPDVVFEDWEKGTYEGWTATGTAFGDKPRNLKDIAGYQGSLNAQGQWTVNTHETRHGEDVVKADTHTGTLTSREFTVERDWIRFRIGGGNHPEKTCINLLVDGKVVRTATGRDNNRMRLDHWDVKELAGRKATIQIVDDFTGGWGQIGIDEIVFTDSGRLGDYVLEQAPDFGSMVLAAAEFWDKDAPQVKPRDFKRSPLGVKALSTVHDTYEMKSLKPGASAERTFVLAWHFPNPPREQLGFITDIQKLRRHYAARFKDAGEVAAYVLKNLDRLSSTTRAWRDAWYDSTLPRWFLDRTFATVSTAATTTCWKFDNGRFYGWEGTYCCAGTCTHVWQYAQALGRTFPSLERSLREKIDFGQEFDAKTGLIHYRGEAARELAIDGQCGTIIRAWREHTMSADDAFLRTIYPNVKKAMELVIARDEGRDGILDGAQYNTLDTTWYGKISWITSLYIAALRASAAMAADVGDGAFERLCTEIAEKGVKNIVGLFNGEYFVHKLDPKFPGSNAIGDGCHTDQLLGQSMAHQMGLPRVAPVAESRKALASIHRYCLAPDAGGAYRKYAEQTVKGGRWYAMPGEGGLVMCTWPKGGSEVAAGKSQDAWAAGYFNECWTGYEGQAASHMIAEGLVQEGLAVTRMYHDRHHGSKRNPYNEVECSSHYARAMSGYGSFVSACGFTHHGPRGELRFAPRVFDAGAAGAFRAAFIGAEGWGTYDQKGERGERRVSVRWGKLTLRSLKVPARKGAAAVVTVDGKAVNARVSVVDAGEGAFEAAVAFDPPLVLGPGSAVAVTTT